MAPIRVGFIGLSKSGWAPHAHFPYLKSSPDYEIVAICNSSVQSAQDAIKQYELPAETKAYADPEALAADPDVDLVVCSVRVDRHLPTIGPSLKAGKDVFVEWPLGKSAPEARELLRLKNEGGVKHAVVGVQARLAPVVHLMKKLVEDKRVGKVLNSTWAASAGMVGMTVVESYAYICDKHVGGNLVTIHFGHAIDYLQYVLGYGFTTSNALLANRRTSIKMVDGSGKVLNENYPVTGDDTIFLHGILSNGIPISATLRGGDKPKNAPGLDWRIYGETGEIRLTAGGPFLQIGYEDIMVEVHDFVSNTVEKVEIPTDEIDSRFGMSTRNVARLYEEFRKGKISCTFEDAVERHEFIEGMYKQNGYTEL